jgi:hypothetical protein
MRLTFREVLRGYVGHGVDHADGFADGRRSGGALTFSAVATIENLDTFETDPKHPALLEGTVDYAPIGRGLPIRDGVLHLFVPAADGRRLRYRIPFEAAGRRYEIRGEKRVSRRPSLRALTTLYVDLVEHRDAEETLSSSEPLARGWLRVPLVEAIRFPFTVRVPGRSRVSSVGPALRFLWFAQRQLAAPSPALP